MKKLMISIFVIGSFCLAGLSATACSCGDKAHKEHGDAKATCSKKLGITAGAEFDKCLKDGDKASGCSDKANCKEGKDCACKDEKKS